MTTDKPEPYEVMMRRAQESMREIASAHAAKVEGTALIGELRLWASLIGTQPRGARELLSRAADALEAHETSAPTPPADDVREALSRAIWKASPALERAVLADARLIADAVLNNPDIEVRPRGTVTDAESEFEYCVLNGLGHGIYMAETLEEAREDIAKEQRVGPGELRPKRSIVRRRRAGNWETFS